MGNDHEYHLKIAEEMLENPEVAALGLSVETLAFLDEASFDVVTARIKRDVERQRAQKEVDD